MVRRLTMAAAGAAGDDIDDQEFAAAVEKFAWPQSGSQTEDMVLQHDENQYFADGTIFEQGP